MKVSSGNDVRIWVSPTAAPDATGPERLVLSERGVAALAHQGVRLESTNLAETLGARDRLQRGDALYAATDI